MTVLLTVLAPASARAATTVDKGSVELLVQAAPGAQNNILIDYVSSPDCEVLGDTCQPTGLVNYSHIITDTAGVFVTPNAREHGGCGQSGANTASCGDPTTPVFPGGTGLGVDMIVTLGDGSDTFLSENVGDIDVFGGPGPDALLGSSRPAVVGGIPGEPGEGATFLYSEILNGEGGNDLIKGFDGPDSLTGGRGKDKLDGGKDNDLLDAKDGRRDKKVDCGPGKKDTAKIDKADSVSGCERIRGV